MSGHDIDDDRYFDLKSLAAYSGLHPSTLKRFMLDPVHPLPHHNVTRGLEKGRLLIRKRAFDAWIATFPPKRPPPQPPPARRPTPQMAARVAAAVRSIKGE